MRCYLLFNKLCQKWAWGWWEKQCGRMHLPGLRVTPGRECDASGTVSWTLLLCLLSERERDKEERMVVFWRTKVATSQLIFLCSSDYCICCLSYGFFKLICFVLLVFGLTPFVVPTGISLQFWQDPKKSCHLPHQAHPSILIFSG